jgi:Leucine-rich repeat (LRR) protein
MSKLTHATHAFNIIANKQLLPNIRELHLRSNNINSIQTLLDVQHAHNLKVIDLSDNILQDFQQIVDLCKHFKLEKLVLDQNMLKDFNYQANSACESLLYFSISENPIATSSSISSLMSALSTNFCNLQHLVIKNIPLIDTLGQKKLRNAIISRLTSLQLLNHSIV